MILTAKVGTNADLIADVAKLYLKKGAVLADLTYGKGVFWKNVDLGGITLLASDIKAPTAAVIELNICLTKQDCRKTLYVKDYFDVVVLDPPYMHGGGKTPRIKDSISKCYGNNETNLKSHADIINFYRDSILEAYRILKPGGLLWVKCQDEIESGKQKWSHIEIYYGAKDLFTAEDLFVLVQKTIPAQRWKHQLHARKNNSYLWIFRKRKA